MPHTDSGRYTIETFRLHLSLHEQPIIGKVSDINRAVLVIRQVLAGLDADQEHFILLALNQQHAITGYKVIASGGMTEASIDPKIVFRAALLLGATAVIVAHNHPSGNPTPSAEDRAITRQLKQAAEILTFRLLDSLIVTGTGYFSFAEAGEL